MPLRKFCSQLSRNARMSWKRLSGMICSISEKNADPGDVDIFLIMEDTFDAYRVQGKAAIIFDHLAVQNVEGASVF
jgi:hypothetical protein